MSQKITTYALGVDTDLTTPTATKNPSYQLGDELILWDEDYKSRKVYQYIYSSTGCTAYQPFLIRHTGTAGTEVQTNIANVSVPKKTWQLGIPQVAITSGYYGFVQTEGVGTGLVTTNSSGYIAGARMTWTKDATSLVGSTVLIENAQTVAYLVTATSGSSGKIYMTGKPVIVLSTSGAIV